MTPNPFKPTAGKMPPILIGRESVLADFQEGLDNGAGAPGRLMLVTGQRGYGKTVLLTEMGRMAQAQGWVVVADTASEGMCARMIDALTPSHPPLEAQVSPSVSIGTIAHAELGGIRIGGTPSASNLRSAIRRRLAKLPEGKGILFTVDESQTASRDEMVNLAITVQHTIRDEDMGTLPDDRKRGVAFVFAGLPSMVDRLVNDDVLTFLRRCMREDLEAIRIVDTKNAFIATIEDSGMAIAEDVALTAARATGGYPYMIQLIGYYMWQTARRRHGTAITATDVERAVPDAQMAFREAVCDPAYRGLSESQQAVLLAMLPDHPNASRIADIVARTGASRSWINRCRDSLVQAHVLEVPSRGRVRYAIPQFADYLAEIPNAFA